MIGRALGATAGALALAVMLSGCYESPDAKFFEAGEYRGAEDPLLARLEDPEFREDLNRRFDGQRDR